MYIKKDLWQRLKHRGEVRDPFVNPRGRATLYKASVKEGLVNYLEQSLP